MRLLAIFAILLFCSCKKNENHNVIRFGIDVLAPPYSYIENGQISGFLIDLDNEIAKSLNKTPKYYIMRWVDMIGALNSNHVDVLGVMTITEERKKNVDFSDPYYFDYITAVFRKNDQIVSKSDLNNKKISVTVGGAPEVFATTNLNDVKLIFSDSDPLSIELLKAKYVDAVLMEASAASIFIKKHSDLSYKIVQRIKNGAAIATQKNSALTSEVNKTLDNLKKKGVIKKLEKKWFGDIGLSENNWLK
jgi:polar amino acid transport system substrate-binding protein